MKRLGLYTEEGVQELNSNKDIEIIDCSEGCLLDNLLFYNDKTKEFFLCLEHYQNEYSSCYEVYCSSDREKVFQKWN